MQPVNSGEFCFLEFCTPLTQVEHHNVDPSAVGRLILVRIARHLPWLGRNSTKRWTSPSNGQVDLLGWFSQVGTAMFRRFREICRMFWAGAIPKFCNRSTPCWLRYNSPWPSCFQSKILLNPALPMRADQPGKNANQLGVVSGTVAPKRHAAKPGH